MQLIAENQLTDAYAEQILPFWQSQVSAGEFSGVAGVKIAYAFALNPDAQKTLVISSGRIETLLKYQELVFDFFQAGYSVFIFDHRGQGLSGRMIANAQMGFVEDFADFVTDMHTFVEQVVQPQVYVKASEKVSEKAVEKTPLHLLCHSMGGCIGALYCATYPHIFQKAVLSAPMWGIRPALPNWFAHALIGFHQFVSGASNQNPKFFFGQTNYESTPFDQNELTHSQTRYEVFQTLYREQPNLQLGGVTSHWLAAAQAAMQQVLESSSNIHTPILLMQAERDSIVDNHAQDKVLAKLPNAKKWVATGAKHEILMEVDEIRSVALAQAQQFFAE